MVKMHKTLRKKTINGRTTNMPKKNNSNKKAIGKRAKARKAQSRSHSLGESVSLKMLYGRTDTLINKLIKAKRIRDKLEQLASRQGG
jgi:hypothetical protein